MKVVLTQENLNKALIITSRVVGLRTSLPVLSNILLKTDKKRLKLSSTNLEIGINHWIGAKVDEEGEITVPARLLSEYISNLPEGNIELFLEKQSLHIKTDHYQSTINGIGAAEFPSIPQVEKGINLSIPAQEFTQAINQVAIAASADDARPVLNGVYLYSEDEYLIMVATDSYRLAEKKIKLTKSAFKKPLSVIVPARTMQELSRTISDGQEEIEMRAEENQVLFKFNDTELVSRLIDGQFPNYQQLIPKEEETKVSISTEEFTNITKVASLFARENAGGVTLKADTKASSLSIKSIASQIGENTSEAQVKAEGKDAEVTLNSRYLLDGLGAISESEVDFAITGKVNPCILRPKDNANYFHIIMPLRS